MSEQTTPVIFPMIGEPVLPEPPQRYPDPKRFKPASLGAMMFLIVCTIYFLIPFFWIIVASTKNQVDLLYTFGFWFSPRFDLFANLYRIFVIDDSIFVRWLLNTLIYAGARWSR